MSYDLVLLSADVGSTNEEVAAYYVSCGEGDVPEDPADPVLDRVLSEISQRYPDLDSLPCDKAHDSPWACGFERGPRYLVMCIRWSRSEELFEFISKVAIKYDVIFYDPQGNNSFRGQNKLPEAR